MAVFPRISNLVLVGLAFISLISAQPAKATMSAEDGKRLKTIFTDMIDRYRNEAKMQGGELLTEGEVMVEPSDTYYAITLPHITLVFSDKAKMNLGMISINALPGDKKQEWKMTLAMPTPITMQAADGKEMSVVEIGSQNFAGVFHEEFRNFVRLNAQYNNVTFTDRTNNAKIMVPAFSAIYDLKEGSNKLWSGPMSAKASNIQGIFNDSGSALKIREVTAESSIKDYSIKDALAYQDKVQALLESLGTDRPSLSSEHAKGMYNTFFDFLTTVWDGFGSSITVSGLEMMRPASAEKEASTVKIERIGFGLEGSGFRNNKVTLRQTLNMTDLSLTPPPTGLNKAAPNNVNIDLTLTNLPFKELAALGQKTLDQSIETPEGRTLATMNGLATMQQLMTDAGTSLIIKNTRVGNLSEYDVLMNGTANANIKALFGATAKTRLEIFGIDKLIGYAQQAAADPAIPAERKTSAQSLLQTLTILQMVGQQSKNANGQDIRTYDLELTADGKTLLNGADLMTVMGGVKPTP